MRLPKIRYSDNITKQTQVRFKGYYHSLYAKDGDVYDMKNMSSDQYPLLTPRKNRQVYQTGTEWNIYKDSDFTFGTDSVTVTLADGIGGSVIKAMSKVSLSFEDGSSFSNNTGEYVVKDVINQEEGTYKITFYDTGFSATGEAADEKNMTITVIGYVGDSNSVTKETRLDDSYTQQEAADPEYYLEGDTFTEITYSIKNTSIQTKTVTERSYMAEFLTAPDYSTNISWILTLSDNYLKIESSSSNLATKRSNAQALYNKISSMPIRIELKNTDSGIVEYIFYITKCERSEYAITMYFTENKYRAVSDIYYNINLYNSNKTLLDETVSSQEVLLNSQNKDSTEVSFDAARMKWNEVITNYNNTRYMVEQTKVTTVYEFFEGSSVSAVSIGSGDCLYWVTSDGYFFYDGVLRGKLSVSEKVFSETGAFIWIMPDMVYYNKTSGTIVENTAYTQAQRKYSNGSYKLYVEATKIEIDKSLSDWQDMYSKYKAGNTIKILITDVDYKKYEYSVSILTIGTSGDYGVITFAEGTVEQIAAERILKLSVAMDIPDLKFVCAANNRIWGCNDDTIFCSVFGQPFNWFDYSASGDGNVGDIAWSITPFTSGTFTGCVAYRDTPVFFMEDKIIVVNGSRASNFELSIDNSPGVLAGAQKSIVVSNDNIYYLSRDGIIRYYSYTPINISEEFYERFSGGCGGADNLKVFMSLWNDKGVKLFVYDIGKKVWMVEDDFKSKSFTYYNGDLLGVSQDNEIFIMNRFDGDSQGIESFVEFGDYYCSSPDKKVLSKLYIRLSIDEGASVEVLMNYDSKKGEDEKRVWESVKKIEAAGKKSFVLPIIPKRCDHFRIKIKGAGGFVVYGVSHEYYVGTFM